MKKRGILAMFLSAAMVMTSAALPVFAEDTEVEQSAEYDGIVAPEEIDEDILAAVHTAELDAPPEGYVQNDETKQITVSTPDALMYLASYVNDGNSLEGYTVTLTTSIDMQGQSWIPIGLSTSFKGTFDGNGKTISNLTCTFPLFTGLFGYVDSATIKNFALLNPNITGAYAAGVVAYGMGNGTISGITVTGGSITGNNSAAGGIAGYISNSATYGSTYPNGLEDYSTFTIEDCTNDSNVLSNGGPKAAGIVAHAEYTKLNISNCHNTGTVTAQSLSESGGDTSHAGGIAGYIMRASVINISSCSNSGIVEGINKSGLQCNIGGIISTAHQASEFNITGCTNARTGQVTSDIQSATGSAVANAGGIVGRSNTVLYLSQCRNYGNIFAKNINRTANAGGLIGLTDNSDKRIIDNCGNFSSNIAAETVSSEAGGTVPSAWAGALVGYIDKSPEIYVNDWENQTSLPLYGGKDSRATVYLNGDPYTEPTDIKSVDSDISPVSLAEESTVSGEMTLNDFYGSAKQNDDGIQQIDLDDNVILTAETYSDQMEHSISDSIIIDLHGHSISRKITKGTNIDPYGGAMLDVINLSAFNAKKDVTVIIQSTDGNGNETENKGEIIGLDFTPENFPDISSKIYATNAGISITGPISTNYIANVKLKNIKITSGSVDDTIKLSDYSNAVHINKGDCEIENCEISVGKRGLVGIDFILAGNGTRKLNIKSSIITGGTKGISALAAKAAFECTIDNSKVSGGSYDGDLNNGGIGIQMSVMQYPQKLYIQNDSVIAGGNGGLGGGAGIIAAQSYEGSEISVKDSTIKGGYGKSSAGGDALQLDAIKLTVEDSTLEAGKTDSKFVSYAIYALEPYAILPLPHDAKMDISVKNSTLSGTNKKEDESGNKAGVVYISDESSAHDSGSDALKLSGDIKIPEGSAPLAGVNIIPDGNFDVHGDTSDIQINGADVDTPHEGFDNYRVHVKLLEDTDEAMLAAIGDTPSSKKYNIALTGYGLEIYRYMSAELTLAIKNGEELTDSYNILGTDHSVVTDLGEVKDASGKVIGHKYGFNMDGAKKEDAGDDDKPYYSDMTGSSIVIGQIELTGYGKFTAELPDAVVQTAVKPAEGEGDDNIVHTYRLKDGVSEPDPENPDGEIHFDKVEMENSPAMGDLSVNVMFPNKVDGQKADYTDMQVTISGILLDKPIEVALGNDKGEDSEADPTVIYKEAVTEGEPKYAQYSFTQELPEGRYTVTFSGKGYRTFSHDVLIDGDKTMTVWNNVMDKKQTIIKSSEDDKDKFDVTFLAGDIVMDNTINLYDLSAAVAYFGTTNDTEEVNEDTEKYIQYDLNRDGKIDSKDVAMVLVSWGR